MTSLLRNLVRVTFLVVASSWSLIQILLPVITAVTAVIITVIAMQIYHKHLRKSQWQGRILRFVRPVQRVKTVDKADSWAIESPIDDARRYELVTPSPDLNGSMYPFGPNAQTQTQNEPLFRNAHGKNESFDGFDSRSTLASWRVSSSLKNIRAPWKKGPTKVKDVVATTEFDIDNYQPTPPTSAFGEGDFPRVSGFEAGEELGLIANNERQTMAGARQVNKSPLCCHTFSCGFEGGTYCPFQVIQRTRQQSTWLQRSFWWTSRIEPMIIFLIHIHSFNFCYVVFF